MKGKYHNNLEINDLLKVARNFCNAVDEETRKFGSIPADPSWSYFENFLLDMGYPPLEEGKVLHLFVRDRSLGFFRKNCFWTPQGKSQETPKSYRLKSKRANYKIIYGREMHMVGE